MDHTEMATYDRLKAQLRPNPLNIDQELIEMPALVMEAAEMTAFAVAARDAAAFDFDLAEARAADDLRVATGANKDGSPKMKSEAQIKSELPNHPLVRTARAKVEETKLDTALWMALSSAMHTKSGSLERVSNLIQAGFITRDSVATVEASKLRRPPRKEI